MADMSPSRAGATSATLARICYMPGFLRAFAHGDPPTRQQQARTCAGGRGRREVPYIRVTEDVGRLSRHHSNKTLHPHDPRSNQNSIFRSTQIFFSADEGVDHAADETTKRPKYIWHEPHAGKRRGCTQERRARLKAKPFGTSGSSHQVSQNMP